MRKKWVWYIPPWNAKKRCWCLVLHQVGSNIACIFFRSSFFSFCKCKINITLMVRPKYLLGCGMLTFFLVFFDMTPNSRYWNDALFVCILLCSVFCIYQIFFRYSMSPLPVLRFVFELELFKCSIFRIQHSTL